MADLVQFKGIGQFSVDEVALDRGEVFEPDGAWSPELLAYHTARWRGRRPSLSFVLLPNRYASAPEFLEGSVYELTVATAVHGPVRTWEGRGLRLVKRTAATFSRWNGLPTLHFEGDNGSLVCLT